MGKMKKGDINTEKEISFALPPREHYQSRKEWENACWHKISKSRDLLELLVTFYERHNLVMRAAVINGINSRKRFKQIEEELQLSPQTISSIKKAIVENSYRSYRERGKTERRKKVYSRDIAQTKNKPHGRPVRTKYGTVYMPY